MPAARVSPASIERNHHPHRYSHHQRIQEHRSPLVTTRFTTVHPSTRSSACSTVVEKGRVYRPSLVQHPSKDHKVANENSFLGDSIRVEKQREDIGKKSWSSFAKRYREWTNRYDNLPRVVDFYGQFEPVQHPPPLLFNCTSYDHQVHTKESTNFSVKQPCNNSQESTTSSNLTNSGHNASTDSEVDRVAIKILDKSKLDSKTQVMLNREISSMEKLHHPNLVQLFEVIENFTKIHLVLEYASGGELYQKISNQGKLIEPVAKSLFAQIISAIDHMHRHHIIHRDIKAENVFFSDPETVKVGDFGFSTQVQTMSDLLNTYCGSPPYAAPELFSDECYIGPPVDLWACGVLLYFMVTAAMPFKAGTVTALKKLILEGDFVIPDYVSFECSWLIRSLLQRDPLNRLETKDVQKDKWLNGLSFKRSLPKYDCTSISEDSQAHLNEETPSEIADLGSESKLKYHEKGEEEKVPTQNEIVKGREKEGKESEVSKEVKEAMECLEKLGITSEMLIANQVKGVRSSITGIFRITFHRIISGKHLTRFDSQDSQEQHLEKKNSFSPPPIHCSNKNGSLKREIDTNQNNGRKPNGPSSSESSSSTSRGGGENDSEKSNTTADKVIKVVARKGSNNNLMRMPQIFTDSEGYITLPANDQVKNGGTDTNSGYKANITNGTKELNQDTEPLYHHLKHLSLTNDQVMVYDPIYRVEKKKKKKSWKKRFVSCCVS